MKIKTLLSAIILMAFALIGGGSVDDNGNIESWVWIAGVGFVIILIIAGFSANAKAKEVKAKEEEKKKREKEALEEKIGQYNIDKQTFIENNGTPDKSIKIKEYDLDSEIHVYEKSKKVFIGKKEVDFKDIMSCKFTDNPRVIKGKISSTTTSDTGSTIGRSIVGGAVAGPAGAIIGGTTSKKHTEYTQGEDKTIHDYTVIINVNSISEPIIRINTGEDGKLTNDIVGLMNVIITRK